MPNENDDIQAKILAAEDKFRNAIEAYHNAVSGFGVVVSRVAGFTIIYEVLDEEGHRHTFRFHDDDSSGMEKFGRIFYADKVDAAHIMAGVLETRR